MKVVLQIVTACALLLSANRAEPVPELSGLLFDSLLGNLTVPKSIADAKSCEDVYTVRVYERLIVGGETLRGCGNVEAEQLQNSVNRRGYEHEKRKFVRDVQKCLASFSDPFFPGCIAPNVWRLIKRDAEFSSQHSYRSARKCVYTEVDEISDNLKVDAKQLASCNADTGTSWHGRWNWTWQPEWNTTAGPNWNWTWQPEWNTTWQPNWNWTWQPEWNTTVGPNWNWTWQPEWNTTAGPNWNWTWQPEWNTTAGPNWNWTWQPEWNTTWQPNWNWTWQPEWNTTWQPNWNHTTQTPNWNSTWWPTRSTPNWNTTWQPNWNTTWQPNWNTTWQPNWNTTWQPNWNTTWQPKWNTTGQPKWTTIATPPSDKSDDGGVDGVLKSIWNKLANLF